MKNFDFKIIYGLIMKDVIWIRVVFFNWGLAFKRTPLLFSERNGYKKYLKLPFGWRLIILTKQNRKEYYGRGQK